MCPVRVPDGGFQVAGRCECPVSLEPTPNPKKEGGMKNSLLASHSAGQGLTSSPLVCSPLRRAFTRDGRNTKRAGIDFLLGGGGREGRLLEGAGVDCPHQTPLLFSHPSPFLLLSFSSAWLWGDPLFVSQAVEHLLLTTPPSGSLSFPFFLSVFLFKP